MILWRRINYGSLKYIKPWLSGVAGNCAGLNYNEHIDHAGIEFGFRYKQN
jgi:hypothetical protein